MEKLYYSTSTEVLVYTGIEETDIKTDLEPNFNLNEFIEDMLVEAKDLIDNYTERDFHEEGYIPSGIHLAAKRIVANMIAQTQIRRDTRIVKVDDFNIQMIDDRIFTKAIKDDLKLYVKTYSLESSFVFRRLRRRDEVK